MNPQKAAGSILNLLDCPSKRWPSGKTIEHARWMLEGIEAGYIQHEKAHRWLGYAQALIVTNDVATLDEMKRVNHDTDEDIQK